jgi:hypothetical protein
MHCGNLGLWVKYLGSERRKELAARGLERFLGLPCGSGVRESVDSPHFLRPLWMLPASLGTFQTLQLPSGRYNAWKGGDRRLRSAI